MEKSFADRAIKFYRSINAPESLPDDVTVMNPYSDKATMTVVENFFLKYYSDNKKRKLIIGINPGRFGAGVTGIGFTDPINLQDRCGIKNEFDKKPELSSKFVYKTIEQFGGPKKFFSEYFISAMYPLALIKDSKNYNYYDSMKLYNHLKSDIVKMLKIQIGFGIERSAAICFGKKNYKFFSSLNMEYNFVERIEVLDHPRYIMQYRLKKLNNYLEQYLGTLSL